MAKLRATYILVMFFALTVPLLPVQALLLRFAPDSARRFPNWYHRRVCKLFGISFNVKGAVDKLRPVLLVVNHTTWLDIPVLSAIAPVSFVAKKEVANWPFISWLARLQRSVFIDRERRRDVARATTEMLDRLAAGDNIVLFAEGTSSDGNRVLSFRTSLFAAAKPPEKLARPSGKEIVVQTVAVVYRNNHGVPFGRSDRALFSWFGDKEMLSHAWQVLEAGPLTVDIAIGKTQSLDAFKDRKELARCTETDVRNHVIRLLRGLPFDADVAATASDADTGRYERPAAPALDRETGTGEARPRNFR